MKQNDSEIVLSICIPTYNRRDILKGTLDEILSYPNDDIEVIVIDNASTDGTDKMLDNYEDFRLKVRRNALDTGMFSNQLEAVFGGSGKYTVCLMDRDRMYAGKMQELISFLRRTDVGIIRIEDEVKNCRYKTGGKAAAYVMIRTHPSCLIYKTALLRSVCDQKHILDVLESDPDFTYAYTQIVGLLMLNWDNRICLYPNNDLVRLEVKKVQSYARYKMNIACIYYMPEGAKRRYLKCIEEIMPVYSKEKIMEYLPYIFASECYRGTRLHYDYSHIRKVSRKYNVKKIGLNEYVSFGIDFYMAAIEQKRKFKICKAKTGFMMMYVLILYLLEMFILLEVPSKEKWMGKLNNQLRNTGLMFY